MNHWMAGVASADVTADVGTPMYAFPKNAHSRPSERVPRLATSVHDPCLAKALVLSDGEHAVAICTLDVCVIPGDVVQQIRDRVVELDANLQAMPVLVAASHTHHGPVVEIGETWTDRMVDTFARTVVAASSNRQPAHVGVASGSADLNFNRRVVVDGHVTLSSSEPPGGGQGLTDPELGVFRVDTVDGRPIAIVVNYTAHPLVMGPANLTFTADYPGALRTYLERSIGGGVEALFLNGGAGNIHPKLALQMNWDEVERLGTELGRAAMPVYQSLRFAQNQSALPGEHPTLACVQEQRTFQNRMDPSLESVVEIDVVRIGDTALCFVPGEFFVEFQLRLKSESAASQTYMVGYANDSVGYVPTQASYKWGGYGVEKHPGDPPEWSRTRIPQGAGETITTRIIEIVNCLEWTP